MGEESKVQNKTILIGLAVAVALGIAIWSAVRTLSPQPNVTTINLPGGSGGGGRGAAAQEKGGADPASGAPAGAGRRGD